ncbi:low molecular weight phosphatase family protein [Hymenobacter ginkgonis]|uniref:hypothetical protein n=1 Tax=Hymenobacter ginkgonis TaxID=2682976 RepID=UPI0018DC4E2C|nr:hypothetical protein [Hymenobacter ginkgonis]
MTVCDFANEVCPVFPSTAKKLHHNFPDPAKALGSEEAIVFRFRNVLDHVKPMPTASGTRSFKSPNATKQPLRG